MRREISRLRELVSLEITHRAYLLPMHAERAAEEYRALLAVARSARRLDRDGIEVAEAVHDVKRALARLDRRGNRKGGR